MGGYAGCPLEDQIQIAKREGEHYIRYATGLRRGYARIDRTPERWRADFRALADVRRRDSASETLSSWVVEDGKLGPKPA